MQRQASRLDIGRFNADISKCNDISILYAPKRLSKGMPKTMPKPKDFKLTSMEALAPAAECLRTLAHPVRLRIVQMLLHDRYTVGQLADCCGIASHVASEHLRLMQRSGFLASTRDGRRIFYEVAEPHLADILACIEDRFGKSERCTPAQGVA